MKPFYDQDGIVIYHGDCREVLPQLSAVDHVITDPPYARDVYVRMRHPESANTGTRYRVGANIRKMAAGEIGHIDEMLDDCAAEFGRLTRRWVVVFSDAESCFRWRAALKASGLRYVRTGAWVKPDAMPQMSGDRPAVGFEPCTIAHAQGRMRWNGGGRPGLWTYNTCRVDRPDHPCPKPEPLMTHMLADFTDPDETVLDPFVGSGTTLLAAKRLGRKAIGIEINERYAEEAARRLSQSALPLAMAPAELIEQSLWADSETDGAA